MTAHIEPSHTRPFNAEHARAGAPYATRGGLDATILKWDGRSKESPLIGVYGPNDASNDWGFDGFSHAVGHTKNDYDLVMTPLGMIDGKPVFVGDTIKSTDCMPTPAAVGMNFGNGSTWRWPAPAPVYPETKMTDEELQIAFNGNRFSGLFPPPFDWCARFLANAALRHAIDAGQLVEPGDPVAGLRPFNPYTGRRRDQRDIDSDPMGILIHHKDESLASGVIPRWTPEKAVENLRVQLSEGEFQIHQESDAFRLRTARDTAIAEAVRRSCLMCFVTKEAPAAQAINRIDLAGLIAGVK